MRTQLRCAINPCNYQPVENEICSGMIAPTTGNDNKILYLLYCTWCISKDKEEPWK